MKYLAAIWLVLSVVIGHEMMGMAFQKGFEQGYDEGVESVTQTEQQVLHQCTAWWFNNSGRSAVTAINEYCDRKKK